MEGRMRGSFFQELKVLAGRSLDAFRKIIEERPEAGAGNVHS
jgi:hypothetical protein